MPGTATVKWSGPTKGDGAEATDKQAQRIWDVVGATSHDDAKASTGIAAVNDPYDGSNADLKCKTRVARQVAPGVYEVVANYQVPPNGEWTTPNTSDPLNEAAIIQWQTVIETEPFDRDVDGKPIVNAAGDAFNPPPTRTYVHKMLKLTKNRSSYAYNTLKQYENTVNASSVTASGVTWPAQTIKCICIEPAGQYRANDTVIPITGTFEIMERTDDSVTTDKPFQLRILNQGINGWYAYEDTVKPGAICTDQGDVVSTEKRLAADGTPLDTRYKIRDGASIEAAVANPTPVDWADYETTTDAIFMVFKRYKTSDFSALFTALGV